DVWKRDGVYGGRPRRWPLFAIIQLTYNPNFLTILSSIEKKGTIYANNDFQQISSGHSKTGAGPS
ncbi:MAG: hypothetical protein R2861_01140, partial [Desulfobacterales bacterium]